MPAGQRSGMRSPRYATGQVHPKKAIYSIGASASEAAAAGCPNRSSVPRQGVDARENCSWSKAPGGPVSLGKKPNDAVRRRCRAAVAALACEPAPRRAAAIRSIGSGWAIEALSCAIVNAGLSRTMLRQLLVGGIVSLGNLAVHAVVMTLVVTVVRRVGLGAPARTAPPAPTSRPTAQPRTRACGGFCRKERGGRASAAHLEVSRDLSNRYSPQTPK